MQLNCCQTLRNLLETWCRTQCTACCVFFLFGPVRLKWLPDHEWFVSKWKQQSFKFVLQETWKWMTVALSCGGHQSVNEQLGVQMKPAPKFRIWELHSKTSSTAAADPCTLHGLSTALIRVKFCNPLSRNWSNNFKPVLGSWHRLLTCCCCCCCSWWGPEFHAVESTNNILMILIQTFPMYPMPGPGGWCCTIAASAPRHSWCCRPWLFWCP